MTDGSDLAVGEELRSMDNAVLKSCLKSCLLTDVELVKYYFCFLLVVSITDANQQPDLHR